MDKQNSHLGFPTPSSMALASSTSTDAHAADRLSSLSPVVQTPVLPVSPVSPPSPHKLKKKRSKKNSESDDKPTLTRAISLSTSSMVTPVLNASGQPAPQPKKKAGSVPKPQTRATPTRKASTTTTSTTAQKPKEGTPPIQEPPSPFVGQGGQLAKPITQLDAEPRAKSAPPTIQLSYAAVTAKSPPQETLISKPIGTTRGKAPKLEVTSQRVQQYTRPAQPPSQQSIPTRNLTPEERQRWENGLRLIGHDKPHLSWLENDAGNSETAKLAVLERIIAYKEQHGTMPMEVTVKTAPNAKGGVEKVVCGPCRQEKKENPKEYPTVQKAAVHITSNHWEMHLWLCPVPGCTKVFRCRDGIQNPKRHTEKAHPLWRPPNNPDPSVNIANSAEQAYLALPPSNYAESDYSYNSTTYAPSVGSQYPEGATGGYPSTSSQVAYYTSEQERQPVTQQSKVVYIQASYAKGKHRATLGALPAPLKLHPPLMPIPPAQLPDSFPTPSPSRSQGPADEFLGRLGNIFGIGTSPTHQVNPTVAQSVAMMSNKFAIGSISPSEMPNVVPAQVPKPPQRRATVDTRAVPSTRMPPTTDQSSLNVVPGRARNVSNPTTMYPPAPFQIPMPIPSYTLLTQQQTYAIPAQQQSYALPAQQQSYSLPAQQMYQPPYATSSHAASLSPQQTSPQYAGSAYAYGQTPESYASSPLQKMQSTSPHSQAHLHLAYPSPASTRAFSGSPPYGGTMPPLMSAPTMGATTYLSPQASGQHSPDHSSRSSLSSSPYPPIDDPLLGQEYVQGGHRLSIGSGSGTGQPLEYANVSSQPPLSSSSEHAQYPLLGDQRQLEAAPLSEVNAYSYAPPPQKTLAASSPLSDAELGQLRDYIGQV